MPNLLVNMSPVDVLRELDARDKQRLSYERNRERRIQQVRAWQAKNPFGVSRGREYVRRSFGKEKSA